MSEGGVHVDIPNTTNEAPNPSLVLPITQDQFGVNNVEKESKQQVGEKPHDFQATSPSERERDKDTQYPEPHSVLKLFKTGGYLGKNILLWGDVKKYNYFPRIALLGPDWSVMIITYIFVICEVVGATLLVLKLIKQPVVVIITIIIGVALIGCLLTTTLSNPGIVFRNESYSYSDPTMSICSICEMKRPKGTIHCKLCNVCCLELDHHCPWMGKCIGKNNLVLFYVTVGFIFFLLIASGFIIIISTFLKDVKKFSGNFS